MLVPEMENSEQVLEAFEYLSSSTRFNRRRCACTWIREFKMKSILKASEAAESKGN
jgi:hypothetical protein